MPSYTGRIRAVCKAMGLGTTCALIAAGWAIPYLVVNHERNVMAASAPSFSADIAPILQKNCLACHSSTLHQGELVLDSYNALMKGGKHGPSIVPHDANGSRIVGMIEGKIDPRMPFGGDPLPASDVAAIKLWIVAGAEGPATKTSAPPLTVAPTPELRPEVVVVSPVSSVKFSPDGTILAVGGYREVRLIDPVSSRVVATLAGHANYVRSIAFSPDGELLAAAGGSPQGDGEIKIWNVESKRLLTTMKSHKDCVYSVAWSPDGKLVASGSYDKMVELWDAATGKELRNLQDHIDAVFAVAFSPDGKHLASASQDRSVKIWDVATGRRLYTLSDPLDGLTSIAFSPSGDQLAAAGYDKTIYIWRLAEDDGHLTQSLIADEESILALGWSRDGKMIVTASSDGSIRFRDSKLDMMGVADEQPDWVQALDISPDGKWLAAGRYNGTLSLYDVKTYKEVRGKVTVFDPLQPTSGDKGRESASR